ncbi:MAG: radical SAM protein [Desulfobacterales bacterium]
MTEKSDTTMDENTPGLEEEQTEKHTREEVFLKTRIFVDGVRYVVKGSSSWDPLPELDSPANPVFIQDGTGMLIGTRPNPRSRLDCTIEGDAVTLLEMGEVLCTGKLQPRAPWRDIVMSDGTIADSGFHGTNVWSDINLNASCHAANSGKGCKFCYFTSMPRTDHQWSLEETLAIAERQIEATSIAVKNGWSGIITCVGGAMPPDRRDQYTTDLLEAYMTAFRQFLDEDVVSQLPISAHVYPPDDLSLMEQWKRFGITIIKYDLQIMDPGWYKAICPGRGSQKRWFEAQEAAVEIFGRDGSVRGDLVAGIEPMEGMLAGIEERISKGVHCYPNPFYPLPGTPLAYMSPPSAEWYMEAFEKTAEIYTRHGYSSDLGYEPANQSDATVEMRDDTAYSIDSTIGELLADEKARAILEKHVPGSTTDPEIDQAMNMTLKQAASHSQGQVTDETLKAIAEDLSKL